MHWLRVVQRKLCDALFHASADDDLGLCPIIHHRINFHYDSVSIKMFGDQYFQHETIFGVVDDIFQVSFVIISKVRVLLDTSL